MTRDFDLSDVLSITTGVFLSTRGSEGVYEILNFMTQDNLYTLQLSRAVRECTPWLLRQHPQLVEVDASGITEENWRAWLAEQVERFGSRLPVEPIPRDDHDLIDPLEEAERLFGANRVIVVDLEEGGPR